VSPLSAGAGELGLIVPQAAPARARAAASGRIVARRVSMVGIVGLPVRFENRTYPVYKIRVNEGL
jgi:hypothetical protein